MIIWTMAKPQILSFALGELVISVALVANMFYQTNTYDRKSLKTVKVLKTAFFFVSFLIPKYKSDYSLIKKESTKNRFRYLMSFNASSCRGFALIFKKVLGNITSLSTFVRLILNKTTFDMIFLTLFFLKKPAINLLSSYTVSLRSTNSWLLSLY